jgi:DNA-binding LytR/AlgR family response regulator
MNIFEAIFRVRRRSGAAPKVLIRNDLHNQDNKQKMDRIKIMVVEDDPAYLVELERIIEELDYELVAATDNSNKALEIVQAQKVHLVLMDINIKGPLNGIELAGEMTQHGIPVIFLTVFDDQQTYHSARQTLPFGYMVKPVHKLNLQSAVDSLMIRRGDPALSSELFRLWQDDAVNYNNLFIKSHHRLVRLEVSDIYLVEAEGNYCVLYAKDRKYAVKLSLRRIRQKLSARRFKQIHRNYIVQISKITEIDLREGTVIILDRVLPIGHSFKTRFPTELNRLE